MGERTTGDLAAEEDHTRNGRARMRDEGAEVGVERDEHAIVCDRALKDPVV